MSSSTAAPAVVTRFAPSPTGRLHVGGARTALFNWAYARRRGGVFLLRIEDTDQARSSREDERGVLVSLAWLDILWDEGPTFAAEAGATVGGDPRGVGPFRQSERKAQGLYDGYIEQLLAEGKAYHAFETPQELAQLREQARREKRPFRYDRAALSIPEQERRRRAEAGEPHVVRFRAPDDEPVVVRDEVLGEVVLAAGEVDDFVIRKADGFPTYHFACVVDDELMGVTHVIRGQEHLANTPRHALLQRALGFSTPVYAHLPLIVNPDGSKMSKRDRDKALRAACRAQGITAPPVADLDEETFRRWLSSAKEQLPAETLTAIAQALGVALPEIDVQDFREAGYLPEVLCNYLALLGWSPGGDVEKFDLDFLAARFDLARLGKSAARFDRDKLLAFNTDAIAAMDDEAFLARFRAWAQEREPELLAALDEEQLRLLCRGLKPRSKTLRAAAQGMRFAVVADDALVYDAKAVEKTLLRGEGLATLEQLRQALAGLEPFSPEAVDAQLRALAEERGVGLGKVAQPLRVALTGSTVSPPIDITVAALGKERALARIDRALSRFASQQRT